MSTNRFDETVGPRGATVRVMEETRGGVAVLKWSSRSGSGYDRESLKFGVRDENDELVEEAVNAALDEAENMSRALRRGKLPEAVREEPTTVGDLFDRWREVQLPDKREYRQRELRRSLECWERFLGRDFRVSDFGRREWDSFRRERGDGVIDARGHHVGDPDERREVGPGTLAHELKALRQVCRWGRDYRVGNGYLLDSDPTRGLDLPRNENPRRPIADRETLEKLLDAAEKVTMGRGEDPDRSYLRELLILATHTGRRIGAIVRLRWSDWSPGEATYGTLKWRASADKVGQDWQTPVTPEVREALQDLRQRRPGIGETYIFSAPESEGHVRVDTAGNWLREAERLAEEHEHRTGFGFHAFRRMWATERKHLPVQDVAAAGGRKDTSTLEKVYQRADEETVEQVVLAGSGG